jgi:hypothetical protein
MAPMYEEAAAKQGAQNAALGTTAGGKALDVAGKAEGVQKKESDAEWDVDSAKDAAHTAKVQTTPGKGGSGDGGDGGGNVGA